MMMVNVDDNALCIIDVGWFHGVRFVEAIRRLLRILLLIVVDLDDCFVFVGCRCYYSSPYYLSLMQGTILLSAIYSHS